MPISPPGMELEPGKGIARTMSMLASASPENPVEVRILVYGQSISMQDWWQYVRDGLQAAYPHAHLVMESRAVGGFHSTRLLRCVLPDVLSFAPDLILFHDYGPQDDYEAIIQTVRSRSAAEIAVQNDHIAVGQDQTWHDRHSFEWLPDLCRRYAMEWIDVRSRWRRHLADNHLDAAALLSDHVHLNDSGNHLMASIIQDHLSHNPSHRPDPYGLVKTLHAGQDFPSQSQGFKLPFHGSRVDLLYSGPALMKILIDGQSPTRIIDTYIAESPYLEKNESRPPRVGIPVRVGLGDPYEIDSWTMYIEEAPENGKEVRFRLYSQSGDWEGKGSSSACFTAGSGRIILNPQDWFVREAPDFYDGLASVQAGEVIRWEVTCLSRDLVHSVSDGKQSTTVVDGLVNRSHTLTIENLEGNHLPIEEIRIFTPPWSSSFEQQ